MSYVQRIIEQVKAKDADQPEFIQAVTEVLESLEPVIEAHPEYEEAGLLERIVEPERIITFRVPWVDDDGQGSGQPCVTACQFNSAIGPYKGGLRLHPSRQPRRSSSSSASSRSSRTASPRCRWAAARAAATSIPRASRSDGEVMRFCQSFMTELSASHRCRYRRPGR